MNKGGGDQHVCEDFLVITTMSCDFKKKSTNRNGDLLIWVSDWSMVSWSMHVSWQNNNIATCFAMYAMEHALTMNQSETQISRTPFLYNDFSQYNNSLLCSNRNLIVFHHKCLHGYKPTFFSSLKLLEWKNKY